MDREKRKANLRKLQLQNTSNRKLRSGGVAKGVATAKISEYFGTPKKSDNQNDEQPPVAQMEQDDENETIKTTKSVEIKEIANAPIKLPAERIANVKPTGSKRTKLKNFLYKNGDEDGLGGAEAVVVGDHVVPCKKRFSNNDFECSEKPVKKAPKIKSQKTAKRSRTKKQQTIESAFLRNEQLFSEIAAQHCLAENFNPDEMQLALAISKSEADAKGENSKNTVDNHEEEVVELIDIDSRTNKQNAQLNESIRSKLKKYGFRTGSKEDYQGLAAAFLPGANRRAKSKWANKFTPLTLRNPDYQLKKLNDKIAEIMQTQIITLPTTTTGKVTEKTCGAAARPSYQLLSNGLRKCANKDALSQIICHSMAAEKIDENNLSKYFVIGLCPISDLKAGHLLKNWNTIQGRDLSPKKPNAAAVKKAKQLQKIYRDLEKHFEKDINNDDTTTGKKPKECAAIVVEAVNVLSKPISASLMTGAFNVDDGENELNAILELINDVTEVHESTNELTTKSNDNACGPFYKSSFSPRKEPPDKRIKLNNLLDSIIPSNFDDELVNNVLDPVTNTLTSLKQNSINKSHKSNGHQVVQQHTNNIPNALTTTLSDSNITRSTSPDLFADSDDEMDKRIIGTHNGITTFEIYASDEVKTTTRSAKELNMSAPIREIENNDELPDYIVDLTQTENSNESLHECKRNSNSSRKTKDTQTLDYNSNSQKSENEKNNSNLMPISSLEEPTNLNLVECIDIDDNDDDDDILLEKLANEGADNTFFNFAAGKQLSSSFHKQTATTATTRRSTSIQFDLISGNDTLFCRLASKYLKPKEYKKSIRKSISMTQLGMASTSNSTDRRNISSSSRNVNVSNLSKADVLKTPTVSFTLTDDNDQSNFSAQVASIDLTQDDELANDLNVAENDLNNLQEYDDDVDEDADDDDDDDDDACLMLSDDEINYSIWKANKSLHKIDKPTTNNEYSFLDIIPEASHSSSKQHLKSENVPTNLSLPDLIDDNFRTSSFKSPTKNVNKKKNFQRIETDFNLDCDEDENGVEDEAIIAAYLATPTKDTISKEREAFGIMESYSEPFGLSQLESDNVENNIADSWQDATFLQSPSEQIVVPVKRISHKFNRLIEAATKTTTAATATDEFNDFDEFDLLIYGKAKLTPTPATSSLLTLSLSPPRSTLRTRSKTPTGLEQLLTADISYNAYDDTYTKTTTPAAHVKPSTQSNCSAIVIPQSTKLTKNHSLPTTMTNNTSTKQHSMLDAAQELTVNGRVYSVRLIKSTAATKPDYTKQTDAELLKQLYNFGIKPLKRKQAIKMLEYIYNQTHPLLLMPETECHRLPPQTQQLNAQSSLHTRIPIANETQAKTTSTKQSIDIISSDDDAEIMVNELDKNTAGLTHTATTINNLCLKDSCGAELLKYHDVLVPQLVDPDEVYIFQTNVSKKTPQPLLPLHIAWHNLVCSSSTLHEAIVMYETIDLQQIYLFFKSIGYRYDPKDLRNFFDRRCVIFRYDLTPANKSNENNRHVRNPNNARRKKQLTTKSKKIN